MSEQALHPTFFTNIHDQQARQERKQTSKKTRTSQKGREEKKKSSAK